jgi:hypothetical protein
MTVSVKGILRDSFNLLSFPCHSNPEMPFSAEDPPAFPSFLPKPGENFDGTFLSLALLLPFSTGIGRKTDKSRRGNPRGRTPRRLVFNRIRSHFITDKEKDETTSYQQRLNDKTP